MALKQQTGNHVPELTREDFTFFCKQLRALTGINLNDSKLDLVHLRLSRRLSELGLANFQDYRQFISGLTATDGEIQKFINALTTNKTDFFREIRHFDYIRDTLIPQWVSAGAKKVAIWSAACSTGEEVYSLAMVLAKYLPSDVEFVVYGSDIDTEVLGFAKNAVYPIFRQSEIPKEFHNFVDVGKGQAEGWFRIRRELTSRVHLFRHNLTERMSLSSEPFDLVLCRNVMIYFPPETVGTLQASIFNSVKPGCYFMIGHSESLMGIEHKWTLVGPSIFKKLGES